MDRPINPRIVASHALDIQYKQWIKILVSIRNENPEAYTLIAEQIMETRVASGSLSTNADNFIRDIKINKPEWYVANEYIKFDVLYKKFKEFSRIERPYKPVLSQCLEPIIADKIHKINGCDRTFYVKLEALE